MREIKFRAWNPTRKKMGAPFDAIKEFTVFQPENYMDKFLSDSVFMQYTGLKDKNGVEIYEGDILNDGAAYVAWNPETCAFCCKSGGSMSDHLYGAPYCEVIGNIHENPELLEAAHV